MFVQEVDLSLNPVDLLSYSGALALLVITPGPVVAAIIARAATGGVSAVLPLMLGVAVGDIVWPLLALLGVGVVAGIWADGLLLLRYFGAAILVFMGLKLILTAKKSARDVIDGVYTQQSGWAGFIAGLAVIIGNPKAVLFYVGVLPGFFESESLSIRNMAVICFVSALIPFLGNLCWAVFFSRAKRFFASYEAMKNTHICAGVALVFVGLVIAM